MRKVRITTPENIEVEYQLADLGSRSAAAVIDITIQTLALLLLLIAALAVAYAAPAFWENYIGWIGGALLIIWMLISYGYYIFTELTMNGMTYGKKLMNIRVIRANGQPAALSHLAIRNLFKVIIDYYGIGLLMIFFKKDCRRLGDMVSSTLVVTHTEAERPVSLLSLNPVAEKLAYYLTEEEASILRLYFERRSSLERPDELRGRLQQHLTDRMEAAGLLPEFREFIQQL